MESTELQSAANLLTGSDNKYTSTENLGDIRDGKHAHPDINAINSRLKIWYRISKAQNEQKGAEI